ncbi:MAG: helix-turn-helix domain-containing protein [Bryobacteraceae bacterium]|nr:helix-turn-helix domain-containing protein [Bryobacteraceae bacterium]
MHARNLRTVRRNAGWTQSEAASRLGVSQPYYSQLEQLR